jgi:hypothetical protein
LIPLYSGWFNKKECTTIALTKAEAMQVELILEENEKNSAVGTSGTNGNGAKQVIINQISEEDQGNIDTIHGNGYKGENYNPNYQKNQIKKLKIINTTKTTRGYSDRPINHQFIKTDLHETSLQKSTRNQ